MRIYRQPMYEQEPFRSRVAELIQAKIEMKEIHNVGDINRWYPSLDKLIEGFLWSEDYDYEHLELKPALLHKGAKLASRIIEISHNLTSQFGAADFELLGLYKSGSPYIVFGRARLLENNKNYLYEIIIVQTDLSSPKPAGMKGAIRYGDSIVYRSEPISAGAIDDDQWIQQKFEVRRDGYNAWIYEACPHLPMFVQVGDILSFVK